MVKRIERNRNTNDDAAVRSGVSTIDNNAITIIEANPNLTEVTITVRSENAWVRKIPANTDPSERKGIFLTAGAHKTFSGDDVHTGEWSGINDKDNKTPTFYVTEN